MSKSAKPRTDRLKLQPHEILTENTLNMLRILWDRIGDLQEENRRLLALIAEHNQTIRRKKCRK